MNFVLIEDISKEIKMSFELKVENLYVIYVVFLLCY